jgi:hypothetical protein
MTNKTSIILVALDTTLRDRQMTGSCIGAIEMYTDREDYELILVDQMPIEKLWFYFMALLNSTTSFLIY